jgi:transposase
MTKKYNAEFKKEVVKEYLKGRTTGEIAKEYGIAKSSVSAWSKIYNEECLIKPQTKVQEFLTTRKSEH